MEIDRSLLTDNLDVVAVVLLGLSVFYMTYTAGLGNGMWVDEGRYGIMATALAEHPLEFSTAYHGTVEKYAPVVPYLLAASQAIFGWGDAAIYLVSPLMLFLTVLITFLFGREFSGRRTGLIAAGLTAFSPALYFISGRVLLEGTLTMLYTASLALLYYAFADREYSRYAMYAVVPVMALAMLTKQPAYALGPVFVIYVLYREGLNVVRSPWDYRPLYIGAGVGLAIAVPWFLRNMGVCGIPLCELQKVASNVGGGATGWESQDPFYYLFNLTAVLGLPFGILGYLASAASIVTPLRGIEDWSGDRRLLAAAGLVVAAAVAAVAAPRFSLLLGLSGITVLQRTDEDLLLWLGIAAGIGIMNLTGIKIPRYVVFTVPVFGLLVGHRIDALIGQAEGWEIDSSTLKAGAYVAIVLAVIASAFMATSNMRSSQSGYQYLDDAGRWLAQNDPDASVIATSPRQLTYYSGNQVIADIVPKNNTELERLLRSGAYDYIEVDVWEYTRREQTGYVIRQLARTELLEPVQVYRQGQRPAVILFRVTPP